MPENPLAASLSAGLEVSIPKTWRPDHVYRFTIPSEEAGEALPGALQVRSASAGGGFRPNLIVCRIALRENQTFETVFDAANDAKRSQDRSFEVLRSGSAQFQGRRLNWQDSVCTAGPQRTRIFQREVAADDGDGSTTMFVFTSDKSQLDKISAPVFGETVQSSKSSTKSVTEGAAPHAPRAQTPSSPARVLPRRRTTPTLK